MELETIRKSVREVQDYLKIVPITSQETKRIANDARICSEILLDDVYQLEIQLNALRAEMSQIRQSQAEENPRGA
jgi:hypothetical protein